MDIIELTEFAHRAFISCSYNFRYMALLIGSLLYLYVVKDRKLAKMLVYGSFLLIVLFGCPLIIKVGISFFTEEDYVKILRLIPTTVIIAYVVINRFYECVDVKQKMIWVGSCTVLLLLSGKYAYEGMPFEKPVSNKYYTEDEYLEICAAIPVEKESKILVCNADLAKAVRRISGEQRLVFGADINTGEYTAEVKQIYAYLEQDDVPLELVIDLAVEEGVSYLILYKWKNYDDSLEHLLVSERLIMRSETENYWSFFCKSNLKADEKEEV